MTGVTYLDQIVRNVFAKRFPSRAAPSVHRGDDGVSEIRFGGFTFRLGRDLGSSALFSFFTTADGLEVAVGSGFNAFEAADYFYADEPFRSLWENLSNEDVAQEIERVAGLIERLQRLGKEERSRLAAFIQGHQAASDARYRKKDR